MAKIHDAELDDHLVSAVDVDLDELEDECARVSSDLAYYHTRAAEAHGRWKKAKAARERRHGELMIDSDFIADLKEQLGKAPNLDQLKSAVLNDDGFEELLDAEIAADVEARKAKGNTASVFSKSRQLEVLVRLPNRGDQRPGHDDDDGDEDDDD